MMYTIALVFACFAVLVVGVIAAFVFATLGLMLHNRAIQALGPPLSIAFAIILCILLIV